MNSKTRVFGFLMVFLGLCSINTQAQYVIQYEQNKQDIEKSRLDFIDTVQNKTLESFSPSERCPYWNLSYPKIPIEGTEQSKRFDLKAFNSISRNEIPGLVALDGGSVIYKPGWATTGHLCYLTLNQQWALIYSSIYIYDYSEEWLGYAMYIQIYSSNGKSYKTLSSNDGEISNVKMTDDGLYLIYGNLNVDTHILGRRNFSYRIINLNTMETELEYRDNDYNVMSLYNKSFGDYICIMTETKADYEDVNFNGNGYLQCFDLKRNEKYTGIVEHNLKYNIKDFTKIGVLFGVKDNLDTNTVLMSFDKDFQKEKIK